MFHLTSPSWLVRSDPSEDRDRTYHVAIHEARIATDYRQHLADDAALAASQRRRQPRFPALAAQLGPVDLACCA